MIQLCADQIPGVIYDPAPWEHSVIKAYSAKSFENLLQMNNWPECIYVGICMEHPSNKEIQV